MAPGRGRRGRQFADPSSLNHDRDGVVITGMGRELSSWIDRRVLDVAGEPVGVVADVYTNATTQRPTWLAINIGLTGTPIAVAPVRGASLLGEDVVIAVDRHTVVTAPAVDVVVTVEPAQEQFLSHHYTRSVHPAGTTTRRT